MLSPEEVATNPILKSKATQSRDAMLDPDKQSVEQSLALPKDRESLPLVQVMLCFHLLPLSAVVADGAILSRFCEQGSSSASVLGLDMVTQVEICPRFDDIARDIDALNESTMNNPWRTILDPAAMAHSGAMHYRCILEEKFGFRVRPTSLSIRWADWLGRFTDEVQRLPLQKRLAAALTLALSHQRCYEYSNIEIMQSRAVNLLAELNKSYCYNLPGSVMDRELSILLGALVCERAIAVLAIEMFARDRSWGNVMAFMEESVGVQVVVDPLKVCEAKWCLKSHEAYGTFVTHTDITKIFDRIITHELERPLDQWP
jgi:hypothetical protein